MDSQVPNNRRQFLRFLAASPLLSQAIPSAWGQDNSLLTDPKDAINLMDFEPAARKVVPPAHWGYMSTGVDDDLTLKANLEGFKRFQLRPRRLVDVSKAD